MFWPHWKYEQYVEDNSTIAETAELVDPPATPIDSAASNIVIKFFPMADWMAWYDQPLDDGAFRILVHRYRKEIADYGATLRRQFAPILTTFSGRALIAEITSLRRTASFRPNWDWSDPLNAGAEPRSVRDPDTVDMRNATARGERAGRGQVGTGRGANSLVTYTPQMWGPGGGSRSTADGDAPDVMIYHELVHSSRQMRGVQEHDRVNRGYDDIEEYLATVLTNVYMSERHLKGLLGEHGDRLLKHPETFLDNSQNIDTSPRQLMLKFKGSQPQFYAALAAIDPKLATFNPVAQFETEQRAGRALAAAMLGS